MLELFVPRRVGLGLLSGVALVHEAHLHTLPGDVLHRCRQRRDLGPILGVGRGDDEGQQMPQGVDGGVGLAPLRRLCPS